MLTCLPNFVIPTSPYISFFFFTCLSSLTYIDLEQPKSVTDFLSKLMSVLSSKFVFSKFKMKG